MKRKVTKVLLSMAMVPMLLNGCFDDPNAPDGPSQVYLNFTIPGNGMTTQSLSSLPNWTNGKALIDRLEFEYDTPDGKMKHTVTTTNTIDFATGKATPELPPIVLEPGLYKGAKFKAHMRENSGISFYINGSWNGTPIRVESDHNEEFHAKTGEFFVDAGRVYELRVVIKPNLLFEDDDWADDELNNASRDNEGRIVISKYVNAELYNEYIKNNLDEISFYEPTPNQ